MRILVTGAAGFIGFHLTKRLIRENHSVVGIDNMNNYYDVKLKEGRIRQLKHADFHFIKADVTDNDAISHIFDQGNFEVVIHLAAQAGVRYSLENPAVYIDSNIKGFLNVLEGCREHKIHHLLYASSSSVYGGNQTTPFSEHQSVEHPLSLYAATKKANELMAHSYSHLYQIPVTGMRFFSVYGPWGRPDMALFKFTKSILEGRPIDVYNHGDMKRDFTYVDDIVESLFRLIYHVPEPNDEWDGKQPDSASSNAPYRIFNVGNGKPVGLLEFIEAIEDKLGIVAKKRLLPIQPGDVPDTCADAEDLFNCIGFRPSTSIEEGVNSFVDWYLDFYGAKK